MLFSCSVLSNSLRPHGRKHTRFPCPSPSPGAYLNSCPLSWWCHPTVLSSIVHFSCFQSCPASGSFPMSQLFASGGQRIGASASASVLSMNLQGWFPLGLTGLISLLSKRLSKGFSPVPQFESITSLALTLLYGPNLTSVHDYWKTTALSIQTFVSKVLFLLFNMLSVCHHKHATVVYWLVWAVALEKQQMQGGDVCELLLNIDLKGTQCS